MVNIVDLYQCGELDLADIKKWLETMKKPDAWFLDEFNRLKDYKNAVEWNQLVTLCEAITLLDVWDKLDLEPQEAYCGKGISGSWETSLMNANWQKLPGSWRDWSKNGDSFKIYQGQDTQNYGVLKLNSQRNIPPTNPFKMGQFIANSQQSVKPFVKEMQQLRAMLEAEMRPAEYGIAFYYTEIRCSFSNHDDEYETVRTEYFHHESDIPPNCESAYVSVKPHIEFGKLSTRRDRLCWRVEMTFTRA
jgi:hypothetical protein